MPSWTGGKDKGTRSYELYERQRILTSMKSAVGVDNAVSIDQLATENGLEARTVRAILSEADGVDFVLAYTDDQRVYAAEWREDAEGYSMKLESQVRTMRDRLARRQTKADQLPRRQGSIF